MTGVPDNKPRPYSTLRAGRIVWVTPEEHAAGKPRRTRLESDDEVRARFKAAGRYGYPGLSAKALDGQLEYWGMPPRAFIEDI